jgi:uncharacterized membrane protein YfcA
MRRARPGGVPRRGGMENAIAYPLLFLAGFAAGVINVVAGGGSFLTLPILMFLGLPAGVANGTNRIGILLQNVGAVWSFDRHGVLERGALRWAALPSAIGAALGAWLALEVSDEAFKRVLAFLMIAVSLYTLWRPSEASPRRVADRAGWLLPTVFFLIGIYGGFVQAGVGFFLLAGTTLAGLDLVRGNAVKVLAALTFTVISLAVFSLGGKVAWVVGSILGAGNIVGGLVGARLTVLKGHRWIRGVVTVTIVAFAVLLLLD